MTILDNLPPLPGPSHIKVHRDSQGFEYWDEPFFDTDQLRERDRIVAEHVVRMCADRVEDERVAFGLHGDVWNNAIDAAHARILALLEQKDEEGHCTVLTKQQQESEAQAIEFCLREAIKKFGPARLARAIAELEKP